MMLRVVFAFIVVVHGAIHLMGFAKAFKLAGINQLTLHISKPIGLLWLFTAMLFLIAAALFLVKKDVWWMVSAPALILSQVLIVMSWRDAKFGTLPNAIVLIPVVIALMNSLPSSFVNTYRAEVQKRLIPLSDVSPVSQVDIQYLPGPVQKYLQYVGAVGKPKVRNFRAVFRGEMRRSMTSSWMDISSRQYDFFDDPARLFYIESAVLGIPFDGLHRYVGNSATMQIKVASVFQVVDAKGEKMNQAETVTLFNDMCLLAPATLIDKSIQWQTVDTQKVKATFTNKGNSITAVLSFNEQGEATDFISNDRYLSADGKTYFNYPWSTPVREYRDFGGRKVAAYGEAIWHTPEGEYSYAKFDLEEIEYNCREFK